MLLLQVFLSSKHNVITLGHAVGDAFEPYKSFDCVCLL